MKNRTILTPKLAAQSLGISVRTLHRWEQAGRLHTTRTEGNHRRIALSEIRRLQGSPELPVRCALSARVSTFKQVQAGNLEPTEELTQDLLLLISVFSGKLYGYRGHRKAQDAV